MSTRRFCDICDAEIPGDRSHDGIYNSRTTLRDAGSHRRRELNVAIRLSPSSDGEAMPDMCVGCVFVAVRSVDPAPRDEEA